MYQTDKNRVSRTFVRNFALLCIILVNSACNRAATTHIEAHRYDQQKMIRIGEVTTLSGTEASFGVSGHRGEELAIEEVNLRGGIQGRKLELITLDDRGRPEETAIAATKLMAKEKVIALTGALPSSRGIAIAPIAQKNQIPLVSSASTHPDLTRFGNFIFRVCLIDPFQGHVMAKFALETLKVKKVALLRDIKSDYSVGLSEFFKETLKKGGGEIVVDQSYSSGDIDFKAQLTAIRAKSPEVVFVPGYYTEGALIARQARELGLTVPLLGGDGWDAPQFLEIGKEAVEGAFFSTHYASEDQSPIVQAFVAKFKKKYGVTPDGLATLGYDSIQVLADAMQRAKEVTPSAIQEALAEMQSFAGVTGNIKFDQNRNPVKSAVVMKVKQGKILYVGTVKP